MYEMSQFAWLIDKFMGENLPKAVVELVSTWENK